MFSHVVSMYKLCGCYCAPVADLEVRTYVLLCQTHPLQLVYTQVFSIAVPLDLVIHPCWTGLAQLACDVLLSLHSH